MIAPHHIMSVSLIPPDAMAAMKLRAALDEACAHGDTYAVEAGPGDHHDAPSDGPFAPAAALR
jgi:hypothetical protein